MSNRQPRFIMMAYALASVLLVAALALGLYEDGLTIQSTVVILFQLLGLLLIFLSSVLRSKARTGSQSGNRQVITNRILEPASCVAFILAAVLAVSYSDDIWKTLLFSTFLIAPYAAFMLALRRRVLREHDSAPASG